MPKDVWSALLTEVTKQVERESERVGERTWGFMLTEVGKTRLWNLCQCAVGGGVGGVEEGVVGGGSGVLWVGCEVVYGVVWGRVWEVRK